MTRMILAVALAAVAAAGSAAAQPGPRGATATLYELPNFQGRSLTITSSTPDLGRWRFNDKAQSAQFRGTWRICEHDDFEGRCQEVRGEVADLTRYGLSQQISSLEPAGSRRPDDDGWEPDRPGQGGRGGRGFEGTRTVFFPRPSVRGLDVAAGKRGADAYCRRQGLGSAVWFDSGERASQAIGPDGEVIGRSPVLRDLLCLRY